MADSSPPLAVLREGEGRTRIRAEVRNAGDDLVIVIDGGVAHAGAVSMAEPQRDGSARTGTLAAMDHRESEVTSVVAREVAARTGRRTVVIAGIHLDRISREEISAVRKNVRVLARRIAEL